MAGVTQEIWQLAHHLHAHEPLAYEYTGQVQQPTRAPAPKADGKTLNVRKPSGGDHSNH